MNAPSEGAKLSSFQTILAEARRRGFSFTVAQGVYEREHGEPCPFQETKASKVDYVKSQGQTRAHHCHWPGCDTPVPPAMWGCKAHWMRLPQVLRDKVWRAYSPGQEVNGTPSRDYVDVANEVQAWIAQESSCVVPPQPVKAANADAPASDMATSKASRSAATTALSSIATWRADFETRSRCDLKVCGSAVYAEDPSTEVLCLAYHPPAGMRLWTPIDGGCPPDLVAHIAAGGLLEAHNAVFEQDIWHYVCHLRYGWPAVPLAQWRDSAALCAAFAIPQSLGKAGAALGLSEVKDDAGHAVMLKLSKPRKPSKHNPSEWHNDPALFEQLYAYCQQDVIAEEALGNALPPLIPLELAVWKASNAANRRGIYCDRQAISAALRMMALAQADYYAQVREVTGGDLSGEDLGSWQKVLPWCAGRGVHLPNYQKQTLAEILGSGFAMPDDVRAVLTIRLALGRASTAKLQAMLDRANADGRIRNTLNYHGAAPGRWAGRGIQPQNLPRGALKPEAVDACLADMASMSLEDFTFMWGDPFAAASNCIRACLTAAPGKVLLAADYSAVEARVANWLAGQEDVLDIFRAYDDGRGPDIYKVRAAATFHKAIADITYEDRQLGKAQELGCQFGLGWLTFISTALAQYGLTVSEDEAKAAVAAYRETHPMVVRMWHLLEAAAIAAVHSGQVCEARGIKFKMRGPHLKCRLPSGRLNTYPFARVEPRRTPWGAMKDAVTFMGEDTDTHQWTRLGSYGGFWMENCTQGVARDLMAAALLRAEARGFPVVLTVHDELVCEIDEANPATPKDFSALMCESPSWAVGLPVAAAGWRGVRYRKG